MPYFCTSYMQTIFKLDSLHNLTKIYPYDTPMKYESHHFFGTHVDLCSAPSVVKGLNSSILLTSMHQKICGMVGFVCRYPFFPFLMVLLFKCQPISWYLASSIPHGSFYESVIPWWCLASSSIFLRKSFKTYIEEVSIYSIALGYPFLVDVIVSDQTRSPY